MARPKPKPAPVSVHLGGAEWKIRPGRTRVDGCECWGVTVFDDREIIIDPGTKKQGNEREILLHESIHVLCPYLDEEVVAAMAVDLDNMLDAMGL